MPSPPLYSYPTYHAYLLALVGDPKARTGLRTSLANAMKCKLAYISQVLKSEAHLSLEQAERLSRFVGHSKDEKLYFLLLVQRDRAGSTELKQHFDEQLKIVLKERLTVKKRLGTQKTLNKELQSVYYSSWVYAAIHVATSVPALQTREALARYLRLPLAKVSDALSFLTNAGILTQSQEKFKTVAQAVRLGNDSHNIIKHHMNWRTQAMESLDREEPTHLHYSGVVSLSESDVRVVKDRLLEVLRENLQVISGSKEEAVFSLCIDFFELKR